MLLVRYVLSKPNVINSVYNYVSLTCLGMKNDWTDEAKECRCQLYYSVHAIVLLVITFQVRE
jgi:hypothetical protein